MRAKRLAQTRHRIAHEAARLMVDGGIRDYSLAKRKAADRLQVSEHGALPRNEEIEQAVGEYLRLFRADSHSRSLARLRGVALEAMRFLEPFSPCLVGPVLRGTAESHSPVSLHLFSEPAEEVGLFLDSHGIPFELDDKRLRLTPEQTQTFPTYCFLADDCRVELTVFPVNGRRQAPLSPMDGRPIKRLGISGLEGLVLNQAGAGGPLSREG